jgi:hypothetical protein
VQPAIAVLAGNKALRDAPKHLELGRHLDPAEST